jgi:uncharacterized protein (TIGR00106 family)
MLLAEFSMWPMDKGVSVSPYVARCLDIVDRSGLPYKLGPLGTCIEGEYADVMSVIAQCHHALAADSSRVYCTIKLDWRKDHAGTLTSNIEAGHVWQGHEALGHVTQRVNESGVPVAPYATPAFDRHATWVGMMIGGRVPGDGDPVTRGIAFDTDLRSGAMAQNWGGAAYALGFTTTVSALLNPYASAVTGFGSADTINSSWGADSPSNTIGLRVVLVVPAKG